jgi:hypothetical protein
MKVLGRIIIDALLARAFTKNWELPNEEANRIKSSSNDM